MQCLRFFYGNIYNNALCNIYSADKLTTYNNQRCNIYSADKLTTYNNP